MKLKNTIGSLVLFMGLVGCIEKEQSADSLITVDVSVSYPKKELVLQDFMDVEYIPLETTDEFLTQGLVLDVGKTYLLVKNRNNDGDIFLFDRKTGKGIRKFNHKGNGPQDYVRINSLILDEANDEIFVSSPGNKLLVYDLYGGFKRCLVLENATSSVLNFDQTNLIGYDMSEYYNKGKERTKDYHFLISKKDGSVTQRIHLPFKTIVTPIVADGEMFVSGFLESIRCSNNKWTLMDTSVDTLYHYEKNGNLKPAIIRKPSVNEMKPEIFLSVGISTDRYHFMQTTINSFDFEKGRGFKTGELMYDAKDKAIYEGIVYNGDFIEKKFVAMTARPVNNEIEGIESMDAFRLIEAYEKGKLKDGVLKDIASKLGEEDNPVIMLVKQRK